jgi:hypothetical protein
MIQDGVFLAIGFTFAVLLIPTLRDPQMALSRWGTSVPTTLC